MEHKTKRPETQPAANEQPGSPQRKPYHPPELTSYGDLAAVTQGLGADAVDGETGSVIV